MSKLNISPDLFLETIELERFRKSLDEEGFRRNILDSTINFGLIKNTINDNFANGKVEADSDANGTKNIKIRATRGIDTNGQFFTLPATAGISIPSDNFWYWLKVNHSYSNLEQGTFTLSTNGDLIDTSGLAKLTKIFRGMPNFPTRIKFVNTTYNTLDYDVLQILNDSHAVIQHPATNGSGIAAFEAETNLSLKIVGTFTPSIAIPDASRYCFSYDAGDINVVKEITTNVSPLLQVANVDIYGNPSITNGFDLARVKSDGTNLFIQDKRSQIWETKGSSLVKQISKNINYGVGIETARFNDKFSAGDKNVVEVAWGMRSSNWSIDTVRNIVTFNAGQGGRYKSVNDFTNGDQDGFRMYTPNGNYSKVLSSIKQGNAVNYFLDVLNIDDYSTDGGDTFLIGSLNCVPDCDAVEIKFIPNPVDTHDYLTETFTFPANTLIGRCDVSVYADDTVLYNVQYRYKSFKEYSDWKVIPSDPSGYFTEISFLPNGVLKPSANTVYYPFVSDPVNGFVQLKLSPFSLLTFKNKVDKGDRIGVTQIANFNTVTSQGLTVGVDNNYQFITGNIVLANDIYFNLDLQNSVDGNEFRFHFNCNSLDLGGKNIYFTNGADTSSTGIIKKITVADIFTMLNRDGGIVLTFKYKVVANVGTWILYQNYEIGQSFQITMFDNDLTQFFDTNLNGNVKGYFGWSVYQVMNGRVPVGYGDITDNAGTEQNFALGTAGGEINHKLTAAEMPIHNHPQTDEIDGNDHTGNQFPYTDHAGGKALSNKGNVTGNAGGDQAHNNMQPYRVIAFIKRQY